MAFDFSSTPRRGVYIHPSSEHGVDAAQLSSRIPFQPVPSGIADAAALKRWLESRGVTDVLTPNGWSRLPDPPEGALLFDSFFYHVRQAGAADDNSKAWACAVLKPFDFPVIQVEDLKRALVEPLPLPFPVGDATYQQFNLASGKFVPHSRYPAEFISGLVSAFIRSSTQIGMSENMHQSFWDVGFCNLWRELLSLADITAIDFNRNVTDPSGASVGGTRPDLMLWILNRLCAKFEEKKLVLGEAYVDLEKKLCNLEAQYYGPVSWIVGVALAGDRMAAWAMRRGHVPDSVCLPLRMTTVPDKEACLLFSVNLLRVALSLRSTYARLPYLPIPYRTLPALLYGQEEQITRELRIIHSRAIKEIKPWSEHVREGFSRFEFVKMAYELQARGLVSGQVSERSDRYKAVMNTVGFHQTVVEEKELMVCLKDVLSGLKALHAAGLVHRDVRWKNVLQIPGDPGFMLIDLETVWRCDEEPLCCKLRDWDESTLVYGKFTRSSDLQLVGKLMSIVHNLSQQARSFQLKLLKHQIPTADKALEELDAIVWDVYYETD